MLSKLAKVRSVWKTGGLPAIWQRGWRWLYWNCLHRTKLKLQSWLRPVVAERKAEPPVCENVKNWGATQPEVECEIIYSARRLSRQLPQTLEPDIHEIFHKRLEYVVPEKYLARLSQARLVGPNGMMILTDESFALELTFDNLRLLQAETIYGKSLPSRKRKMQGSYYSLLLLWADIGNYYHWMHDVLLRLYLIIDKLPTDVQLILPANLKPFQRETLEMLGLGKYPWLFFSGDEIWELETLYYSPPTSRSGHDLAEADFWLRDAILEQGQITKSNPSRRLYISRRNADHWRIANEDLVEACLRNYGFESVLTESLTVCEQAMLFSEATMIVSNQGSGLTNMLFAPQGAKVLDIQDPTNPRYGYWTMSEALKHSYWYFWAEPLPRAESVPDLRVPMEKLNDTLKMMVNFI
jgi:capsular polysaccharide biosynthesis protein